jgi:protease PrsW
VSVTDRLGDPPTSTFARRYGWVAVLVVGTGLFIAEERTLVATRNPNLVPSAILLGASIVPLAFVAFVYGRRLPYSIPGGAVAVAAFLGGVIGTIVAATLEFDVLRDLGALPMAGVGLIEESSKLLVPLALLVVLRQHRSPADGLLVGVACGAGFAALETMGYAFTTLIKSQGSITDTVDILLLRGFLSPAGHMAWTGITAAALYGAAQARDGRGVARFVGAFVGAVVLHTLWDSSGSTIATAVVAVVSLAALTYTAHRAGRAASRRTAALGGTA